MKLQRSDGKQLRFGSEALQLILHFLEVPVKDFFGPSIPSELMILTNTGMVLSKPLTTCLKARLNSYVYVLTLHCRDTVIYLLYFLDNLYHLLTLF